MERVRFDVCGVSFAINKHILDTGPISRLTKMCAALDSASKDDLCVVNRPPELFSAILALYLTGDLHIPMTSCPGAFLKEMEFWEIDPKHLSNCCFYRLQCHQEEQRTLIEFHQHIVGADEHNLLKGVPSSLAKLRARIWSIVDYRGSTMLNKMYFFLTFLMIVLSIMTISLGTCEMFRRNMTNCERLEFMEAAEMKHIDLFAGLIHQHDCQKTAIPEVPVLPKVPSGPQPMQMSFHDDAAFDYDDADEYHVLYVPDPTNVTEDLWNDNVTHHLLRSPKWIAIKIPNMKVPIRILVVLDLMTLGYFTVDFVLRLLSCPSILSYFKSVINIADAAALFGTYMHLVLLETHKEERYKDEWIDVLGLMQMLRSLRLFRLVRNITAARVLVYTFRRNLKDLSILLLFLIVGICTFSSALYILEKHNVENVPTGWYWALITMTTVGYGDIYPQSATGMVIACICGIAGLLLFALTIPIFANHFLVLYQYANLKCFSRLNCKDNGATTEHSNGIEMREKHAISTATETDVSQVDFLH